MDQQPQNDLPFMPPPVRPSQNLRWIMLPVGVVILVAVLLGVTVLSVGVLSRDVLNRTVPIDHTSHLTETATSMPIGATYVASVPGPGCDAQGGRWTVDRLAHSICTGGKLHVTFQGMAIISFLGPSSSATIAHNYEVSVVVTPFDRLGAGLIVRESSNSNIGFGYAILIGNDGGWNVFNDDGGDPNYSLPGGNVTPEATHHLDVTVRGASEVIQIDGLQVGKFTNSEFISGNSVGLVGFSEGPGAADFQDFTYTPLS